MHGSVENRRMSRSENRRMEVGDRCIRIDAQQKIRPRHNCFGTVREHQLKASHETDGQEECPVIQDKRQN
jgi:hypothetical protein